MNLLLMVQKIWRYKWATMPIVALVLIGSFYVLAVKTPLYEASSSYSLLNPPPPPTPDQIAANPRLGRINTNNPYTRFTDQSIVVQVLASRLSSDEARAQLVRKGADPGYTVAPSVNLGYTAPILEVTGTGSTPQIAINTAEIVGRAAARELSTEQAGVAPDYRIKAQPIVLAHDATLKASGQLRDLVGIWAIGAILMFIVVSIGDALPALRGRRPADNPTPADDSSSDDRPAREVARDEVPVQAVRLSDPTVPRSRRLVGRGVLPDVGRAKKDAAVGVETGGDQDGGPVVEALTELRRLVGDGGRVEADDAGDAPRGRAAR